MKKRVRSSLLFLCDIGLLNISLAIAYLLRFDWNYNLIPVEMKANLLQLFIASCLIKLIVFRFFKLYSSLWRYASIYELMNIGSAVVISNSIALAFAFITQQSVPRSIFIIAMLTDVFFVCSIRFGYRIFRRMVKGEIIRLTDSKRILVIGSGDTAALVIKEMKLHPELKSNPVVILSEDKTITGRKLNGVSVLGSLEKIEEIVSKHSIDEIIIAMPSSSKSKINHIYSLCSKTHCGIKILPSVSQLIDQSVIIQKLRNVKIEDLLGRDPINLKNSELKLFINDNAVLVTGGGGSIGSELCRQIASFKPSKLLILDNYENNAYDIQNELIALYPELRIETIIANVREKHRLEEVFKMHKPQIVFHAAAHKHVPLMEANPVEAIKNNVIGTMNVAECADKFEVERFVLISTDKAVNPTNIMGATKRIAEMVIQALDKQSKTEFVAVRFGNVLGSNGSVIPLFKKQIEQGGPVTVTHPDIIRYFMTIPESVQLVLQAGAMAQGGEIFVLDMGEPVKIVDLARNLIKLSGYEPDEDIKIEFTGLRPGEKLFEELLLEEEGLQSTTNNKIFVAKPIYIDFDLLKREIDCLMKSASRNEKSVFEYIKVIVPTYKN